jgi:hypothetical protein
MMQIDLQQPYQLILFFRCQKISKINREGNVYGSILRKRNSIFQTNGGMEQVYKLSISYHGNPVVAKRPPWMVVGYLQKMQKADHG